MGGDFKNIVLEMLHKLLSDWEGLKMEVKRGRSIVTRRFHRKRNGDFFSPFW